MTSLAPTTTEPRTGGTSGGGSTPGGGRRSGGRAGGGAGGRRTRFDMIHVLSGIRDTFGSPKYGPVLVTLILFVAVFLAGGLRYRGFLSGQVFLNLLVDNAYLIVLAVGMTFVIITGGIDLSVGAVVALSTMIAASLLQSGWSPGVVIPLILVLTSLLGLLVGLMIHVFKVQPFIATLAAMFLARGLCYVISKDSISIVDPFFVAFAQTRIPLGGGLSVTPSVIIALVVVVVAVFVLGYTRFGRTVYALGGSEHSGMLMGLPVARTKVLVYIISGFCSGVAGVLFTFYTLSGYSLTAVGTELDAIAAVVIGGTLLTGGYGFVLGSVLGVLVLGVIQTIITFEGTLSSWWTKIFIGALLLVFIILQKVLTARRR
ncbi:galactofuranose ABC transporter, permease protein YjfF [Leifsonia sp. Root4]|uniref:galactofuranose ABC transporter, permease protein YjfF n=1 Tax=Leifsonia sp. Root4 TaxID=1736525 RepID=UPI000AB7E7A6|nr:galactofuranose ABC transporter, permease protein YjfF [Leifsonia sp. Root4]